MLRFLTLIYLIILVFLSLNPWLKPSAGQAVGFITWDKISHAAAYGVLSILIIMNMGRLALSSALSTFIALLCSGLTGVLLEYCQPLFTSSRQFSFHDIVANFFGAFVGALCFGLFRFIGLYRTRRA